MAGLYRNDDCGLRYFAPLVLDRLSADYAVCGKTANSADNKRNKPEKSDYAVDHARRRNCSQIARFTRSSIIEVLKEDYVRTARAKGIKEGCGSEACFPQLHDLRRDGCGSAVRLYAGRFCYHRTVFAYPGLGSFLTRSVNYRDYPAIQSLILIFSLQFIVINLIIGILWQF